MTTAPTIASPQHTGVLIGGDWAQARSGKTFADINPASGESIAEIAAGGPEDVAEAVASARRAFRSASWARINPTDRGRILHRIAELIRERSEEFAVLEAEDVGKRLPDARGEVELSAALFEYYAGAANKMLGEVYQPGAGKLAFTLREPLGVVAAIVPWNYPLPLATLKVAPALAMGNAVVLKPAEEAPLTSLLLGQVAVEAGVPAGILNVVPGLGEVAGQALIEHPDVAMIAFTGSTEVGRKIMHAAAERIAKVELELGGKSPHVIFPDASLDLAVPAVSMGLFKNAGQDCCAGSRVLVHRRVYDEVVDRLKASAEEQRIGYPLADEKITMGPVISERQRSRVHGYTLEAVANGATLVTGGVELVDGFPSQSSFYAPTIFTDVTPQMRIFQEEVFGPVGLVVPFTDEEEAVRLANDSRYGLAAAVWTNDLSTAHRVSSQIEAGMVWINEYYAHVMEMPFGGFKQSGIGKDYSLRALDAYCQLKEVTIRFGSRSGSGS
ncbi:MAG TPA: aldehyde dehydrogenase family protein [Gaiellaceae bacterium]|nr:aldehyde dehydrogenase family protein [Gaiellaceae bacterium]